MLIKDFYYIQLQVNETAAYKCIEGYKIGGESNNITEANIRCIGNDSYAEWDGARPNCERKLII